MKANSPICASEKPICTDDLMSHPVASVAMKLLMNFPPMTIAETSRIRGKHAVVIGRSNIVGKPVAVLLSRKETNATVTLCHTGTPDISKFTKEADIVVVAAGRPNTVIGDMLKPGAVVIDVGVNRVPDATKPKGYRLVGDADFDSCAKVASAITPVPGGVGPMTITMLLWNTLESASRS